MWLFDRISDARSTQPAVGGDDDFFEGLSTIFISCRTVADTFIAWQFPLHNGEAFGLVGRWIVFCTGLVPAVLYVTGFVLWRRRRRRKRRETAADSESVPAVAATGRSALNDEREPAEAPALTTAPERSVNARHRG